MRGGEAGNAPCQRRVRASAAEGCNDTLWCSGDLDTVFGGPDADTFVLQASTFKIKGQILDFSTGEGYAVNISDILYGYYTQGVDVITAALILGVTGLTDEGSLESDAI